MKPRAHAKTREHVRSAQDETAFRNVIEGAWGNALRPEAAAADQGAAGPRTSSRQFVIPSHEKVRFGLLPLVARLLLTAEFAIAVNGKLMDWSGQAAYMASHGMTMINPLLGAALVVELGGAICLVTGFKARAAAAILFVYLGIVTVRLHDFWNVADPMAAGGTQTQFFKNLGMMGGLLMIAAYGPGRWALGLRRGSAEASGITG